MKNIIFAPTQAPLSGLERERLIKFAGEDNADELSDMLNSAEAVAAPKAIYNIYPCEPLDDGVKIAGVEIKSQLMRDNFKPVKRVFPYLCSCGSELEEWSRQYSDDPLSEYWADEIKKLYLMRIITGLYAMIKEVYDIRGHYAQMNPGSIKDWPLIGQRELFAILGSEEIFAETGVRLTESCLMLPSKSVDGIGFESESGYQNCTRCPIIECPNRRAEYSGKN